MNNIALTHAISQEISFTAAESYVHGLVGRIVVLCVTKDILCVQGIFFCAILESLSYNKGFSMNKITAQIMILLFAISVRGMDLMNVFDQVQV